MDLAREYNQVEMGRKLFLSFNPCFNGSCSRISRICDLITLDLVSILVLMDLAREFDDKMEEIEEMKFQSLF